MLVAKGQMVDSDCPTVTTFRRLAKCRFCRNMSLRKWQFILEENMPWHSQSTEGSSVGVLLCIFLETFSISLLTYLTSIKT